MAGICVLSLHAEGIGKEGVSHHSVQCDKKNISNLTIETLEERERGVRASKQLKSCIHVTRQI